MVAYGIKVVPREWQHSMPLPFTQAEHDSETLEQGTRILIYRAGVGIIAEGEVHGFAIHPRDWPAQTTADLPAEFAQADYLQPIGLLYTREEDVLSPAVVQTALGEEQTLASWQPISHEVYAQLANWPT